MKTTSIPRWARHRAAFVSATSLLFFSALNLHGQGGLTPPGAPAPGQKSPQEIWDRIGALETKNQLEDELENVLTGMGQALRTLPWALTMVGSVGSTGRYSSLAFTPGGQPAISYLDSSVPTFARVETWTCLGPGVSVGLIPDPNQ